MCISIVPTDKIARSVLNQEASAVFSFIVGNFSVFCFPDHRKASCSYDFQMIFQFTVLFNVGNWHRIRWLSNAHLCFWMPTVCETFYSVKRCSCQQAKHKRASTQKKHYSNYKTKFTQFSLFIIVTEKRLVGYILCQLSIMCEKVIKRSMIKIKLFIQM